ncbi:hypothetical protein J7382_07210 [Shimia sp. R11_0]|uniref:methyl-accepting chemotaxis protein n=1 Tax=Shimia sp. R11_0 TaxID=2821096 RepID=UPI001ADC4B79|nr:methyl-accepting chemotaxis protein [Shimia sp. R11_0]MBO9477316.1 hypothetical protein [Shimia sp. R11_0]
MSQATHHKPPRSALRISLKRGLIAASIVGPVLTFINQSADIAQGAPLDWLAAGLTTLVPFCVSALSTYLAQPKTPPAPQEPATSEAMPPAEPMVQTVVEERLIYPDGLTDATARVETIRDNATNVNRTSRERVTFISNLIDQAETLGTTFDTLCDGASHSAATASDVGTAVQEVTREVDGFLDLASDTTQQITHIADPVQKIETTLAEVANASEAIRGLADRIRLLALNSGIEAARAGEKGRGFAIIAGEVRELADMADADITRILSRMDDLTDAQADLSATVANVAQAAQQSLARGEACRSLTHNIQATITGLVADIASNSEETRQQLPLFSGIVSEIKSIRDNTEAAVQGSQNNITLCGEALSLLTVETPHNRPHEPQKAMATG